MTARAKIMKNKQVKLRFQLWPKFKQTELWDRKEKKGFTTIPRGMPLIMKILDDMTSGTPVSKVYFDLWCRANDESFADVSNHHELAFSSGFEGQRAVGTWRKRIMILEELGFIKLAPGSSGDISYALILNPYYVVKKYHNEKGNNRISKNNYNALCGRLIKVGANDLEEEQK